MKISKDNNGNKTLKIESTDLNGQRGFSIQTLGNLPQTHSQGIHYATKGEVFKYVEQHGTKRQRLMLSTDLDGYTLDDIVSSWFKGAPYWRELSIEDVEAITELTGGRAASKGRVKSWLMYNTSSLPSWWRQRVKFSYGRWLYVAGQDYTHEMASIRKHCK